MTHEINLPGLSAQLQREAAQAQQTRNYQEKQAADREARKQQRIKDAEYLQRSPVAEVLVEAAKLLREGGHNTSLSVTNPEPTGVYKYYGVTEDTRPIDIRLAWDMRGRDDSSPLVGSDDYHTTVFSWQEVNAQVIRTKGGRVKGFIFNTHPGSNHERGESQSFQVGTSLPEVMTAVDRAIAQPLQLDEESPNDGSSPHRLTYENEGRIEIPLTPRQ